MEKQRKKREKKKKIRKRKEIWIWWYQVYGKCCIDGSRLLHLHGQYVA